MDYIDPELKPPFISSIGVAIRALKDGRISAVYEKMLKNAHLVRPAPNPATPCPRSVKRCTPFPGVGSVIP